MNSPTIVLTLFSYMHSQVMNMYNLRLQDLHTRRPDRGPSKLLRSTFLLMIHIIFDILYIYKI